MTDAPFLLVRDFCGIAHLLQSGKWTDHWFQHRFEFVLSFCAGNFSVDHPVSLVRVQFPPRRDDSTLHVVAGQKIGLFPRIRMSRQVLVVWPVL